MKLGHDEEVVNVAPTKGVHEEAGKRSMKSGETLRAPAQRGGMYH
jgi:hypothetical protein